MSVELLPTVPGKVSGIVGWDPCVLQCADCARTVEQDRSSAAAFIVLAGFKFHACERGEGIRRCPDCLAEVVAACPNARCKQ